MDSAKEKQKKILRKAVMILEMFLAIVVIFGTAWYVFLSFNVLLVDAFSPKFYADFLNILLTAIIGVEIVRLLVTHDLGVILELLGFVMARKALSPDVTAVEVLLIIIAFGVLVYVRKLLFDQNVKMNS